VNQPPAPTTVNEMEELLKAHPEFQQDKLSINLVKNY
jgi:hypothetical protein